MKTSDIPVRIIIADDHELFRDGFRSLLAKQTAIELVAEAANGSELVSLTEKFEPDVVLTDIKMPLLDGIEATRILKAKFPDLGIIALSMFNDDALIVRMLEAGARGYLLKNADKTAMIDAIITVSHQIPYYCPSTNIKLARLIAESRFDPLHPVLKIAFTENEKAVMCLICQAFSSREIAAQLHYSVRTIEGFRKSIMEKINERKTAGIIVYAIRNHIYIP